MSLRPISADKLVANRANAQKSTGPRTGAGKFRAGRNALVHGRYAGRGGYALLVEGTMQELGEDPAQFSRLLEELTADLDPQGSSQRQLVEDLASLRWERRRLERARAALIARRVQELELKRQRASLEVEQQITAQLPSAILRVGMIWAPESATKYQKLLEWLENLKEQMEVGVFAGAGTLIQWIYGATPTPRGALIRFYFRELAEERHRAEGHGELPAEEDEDRDELDIALEAAAGEGKQQEGREESEGEAQAEPAAEAALGSEPDGETARGLGDQKPAEPYAPNPAKVGRLRRELLTEICNITQQYHLFIREHVEVTPVMRGECLAPTAGQRWLMRELNLVDRQIERKTRLFWEIKRQQAGLEPPEDEGSPGGGKKRASRLKPGRDEGSASTAKAAGTAHTATQPPAQATAPSRPRREPVPAEAMSPATPAAAAQAKPAAAPESACASKRMFNGTNPNSIENKATLEERTQTNPTPKPLGTWISPSFSANCLNFSSPLPYLAQNNEFVSKPVPPVGVDVGATSRVTRGLAQNQPAHPAVGATRGITRGRSQSPHPGPTVCAFGSSAAAQTEILPARGAVCRIPREEMGDMLSAESMIFADGIYEIVKPT
jgi:hypothetical protein